MRFSSIKRFLPAAPPRRVVCLPDGVFFVRSVPVNEGATDAEVAMQAELTIEGLAPFAVSQLYYGYYWRRGATRLLVYAAYRKRFTSDELAGWESAEVVIPSFVSLLSTAEVAASATVIVLNSMVSLTGIYYADTSGVPAMVRVEVLPAEATDEDRSRAREKLIRAFPEKLHIQDLETEPLFDEQSPQGEFIFRAGSLQSHFTHAEVGSIDVRDKGELAARRRAQARDVILWRVFLGCAATIALCGVLELALVGMSAWQKRKLAMEAQQRPVVESIMTAQSLATRIDELSTKRLMPFEMMALVNSVRPESIRFARTATSGLYTLEVEAQTNNSRDIDKFRSAVKQLNGCETVEVMDSRTRDGMATFKLTVTFLPEAFKAEEFAQADPLVPQPEEVAP